MPTTHLSQPKYYRLVMIIHLVVMIAAYSSPLWLDWRLVLVGASLYYVQIKLFDGCILTHLQFPNRDTSFTGHYVARICRLFGYESPQDKLYILFNWVLAPSFVLLSIVLHFVCHYQPPIHF